MTKEAVSVQASEATSQGHVKGGTVMRSSEEPESTSSTATDVFEKRDAGQKVATADVCKHSGSLRRKKSSMGRREGSSWGDTSESAVVIDSRATK